MRTLQCLLGRWQLPNLQRRLLLSLSSSFSLALQGSQFPCLIESVLFPCAHNLPAHNPLFRPSLCHSADCVALPGIVAGAHLLAVLCNGLHAFAETSLTPKAVVDHPAPAKCSASRRALPSRAMLSTAIRSLLTPSAVCGLCVLSWRNSGAVVAGGIQSRAVASQRPAAPAKTTGPS